MKTRRNFFKNVGVAGCSLALFGNINLIAAESAFSRINIDSNDYKAMINIVLLGGNDSINTLIDFEENNYAKYANTRPSVAIPKEELIPLNKTNNQYALHPKLVYLAEMFDNNEVAFIANVGTLIEPTTQDSLKTTKLPKHLFSHSDQRKYWENLNPNESSKTGWGGRIADAMNLEGYKGLPPIYGIASDSMWLKANKTKSYIFDKTGVLTFKNLQEESTIRNSVDKIQLEQRYNLLTQAYRDLFRNTMNRNASLEVLLASSNINIELTLSNDFSQKLELVTRIIDLRESFSLSRQMFYIGLGGFDTHSNQVIQHNKLYDLLDKGLNDFNRALKNIGMFDKTVTFITSDFGRSATSNASGTDHGWGGHYFVMGGSVNGGSIYGKMPSLSLDSSNLTTSKRLIPTTSVEQYVATICKWYGLSETNLDEIFPNLRNFEQKDLGFMKV